MVRRPAQPGLRTLDCRPPPIELSHGPYKQLQPSGAWQRLLPRLDAGRKHGGASGELAVKTVDTAVEVGTALEQAGQWRRKGRSDRELLQADVAAAQAPRAVQGFGRRHLAALHGTACQQPSEAKADAGDEAG